MVKPKILKRLVKQLEDKGMDAGKANAIAISSLRKSGNLKANSTEPTKKGIVRGNMTPAERAKDRASKESGKPASKYIYNKKTNKATLKK
jgi:hypothetical protein